MTESRVYVFSGHFDSREAACLYSEPQWPPEPVGDVSDEVYQQWEDAGSKHRLKDNIDGYLDSDFIETVDLDYSYLSALKISGADIEAIENMVSDQCNIFVLVFEEALDGFELESTPVTNSVLKYCGHYACEI